MWVGSTYFAMLVIPTPIRGVSAPWGISKVTVTVSCSPPALWYAISFVSMRRESAGVMPSSNMSAMRPTSYVKAFQESIEVHAMLSAEALLPIARILSPFFRPAFCAGVLARMVSMSAGTKGRQNMGSALSMVSKDISAGVEIAISLPSRFTLTSFEDMMSRNSCAPNSRNSTSSVPMSTSPSLKPISLACSLNFMP